MNPFKKILTTLDRIDATTTMSNKALTEFEGNLKEIDRRLTILEDGVEALHNAHHGDAMEARRMAQEARATQRYADQLESEVLRLEEQATNRGRAA